jgi:O-antigen ligase
MNNVNALILGRQALATFIFLLPWLNPFAPGPSPSVAPWLVSMAATMCLLLMAIPSLWGSVKTNFSTCRGWYISGTWAWLLAGLLSAGISLIQYFGAASFFDPWINQTNYGEAFANLRQRNQFATLTNIALAALLFIVSRDKSPTPGSERWHQAWLPLGFVAGALLAVGNAISSSRTGLFELVLLCFLCVLWGQWRHQQVRNVLIGAVLVYAVAVFAMPLLAGLDLSKYGLASRLGKDDACGSRLMLWSNVLHLIAQKPWLGWGWGELDYAHFITLYDQPRFCDILDNAHNLPLHLAVELGVPFAVLVCGGFTWVALRQKPWAEVDATRQMAWSVMAVILLHSMLEYPLWYGPFQLAFGMCIFLLWRQKQSADAENNLKKASNMPSALILYARAASFLIAISLLVFIAYAAWDYRRVSQIYLPPEARDAHYRDHTLAKIRNSWLFEDQARFAELILTPLAQSNAAWTFNTAHALLHYSPEPRVIEKLIESAVMLGRDDEALAYLARYKAAFPKEHALWAKANAKPI